MVIYTASKAKHAHLWVSLRASGVRVNPRRIDEAGDGQTACLTDLWTRCVREASLADAVLLYIEPGDILKGALVEVGAALAMGKRVYVVGEADGSWVNHPLVFRGDSIINAVEQIRLWLERLYAT